MCVLRVRVRLINVRRCRIVFLSELIYDKALCRSLSVGGNAERVCSHVGDKTLYTAVFGTDIDTLVKLLRHLHDTGGLEAELL